MRKTAPFVVIESLDAAGGSTQTDLLTKHLKKAKFVPHQYHFPQADRATGRLIYEKYLHDHGRHILSRREQALLYIADFFSKLEEMEAVTKKGRQNELIVSDRYCTSTMAYQTIGLAGKKRTAMLEWIDWLCWQGTPALLKPDLVFLLDIPTEIALKRLAGKKADIHERREFMDTVRQSYLRLAQEQGWTIIDSLTPQGKERTRQNIHSEIWQNLQPLLS